MKLTEQEQQDKVVVVEQAQDPRAKQMVGRVPLKPGQKLFELDTKTGGIRVPEYEKNTAVFPTKDNPGGQINHKVTTRPGCIYVAAINLANAKKKFQRQLDKRLPKMKITVLCKKCDSKSVDIEYFSSPDKTAQIIIRKCKSCGADNQVKDYFNL